MDLNSEISYDEMIEIANLGSGVVNSDSLEIARKNQIRIGVGSSQTGKVGSIITDRSFEVAHISGIIDRRKMVKCDIAIENQSIVRKLLAYLAVKRQKIFCYKTSDNSLQFLMDSKSIHLIENFITENNLHLKKENEMGLVAIIGAGLYFNSELSEALFTFLQNSELPFEISEITANKITLICKENDLPGLVQKLYDEIKQKNWLSINQLQKENSEF